MTGYQEALTDPSYRGQILVMTATQMGNYGVNDVDVESAVPQVAGFVIREASRLDSNYRSQSMLGPWLESHGHEFPPDLHQVRGVGHFLPVDLTKRQLT